MLFRSSFKHKGFRASKNISRKTTPVRPGNGKQLYNAHQFKFSASLERKNVSEESPFKGKTGLRRLCNACAYSADGLRQAWRSEAAFRQEALLVAVLVPLSFFLPVGGVGCALMIFSVLLIPIVELLNSAIEAAIDRISLEIGRAHV